MHDILAVPFALAGGSSIFLGFVGVMVVALALGMYTRRGSGIEQRPHDGSDGSPGSEGHSRIQPQQGEDDNV